MLDCTASLVTPGTWTLRRDTSATRRPAEYRSLVICVLVPNFDTTFEHCHVNAEKLMLK